MSSKNDLYSISWKASRPLWPIPTWPTKSTIGVESCMAVWTPIEAFVAPGPRVTKQIPGRPVSFPYASAMKAAPPSCRQMTNRSSSVTSWNASSTARKLSPGTPNAVSTPCANRQSTRRRPPVRSPSPVDESIVRITGPDRR